MKNKQDLIDAAHALGRASEHYGDLYDIVEAFVSGIAQEANESNSLKTEISSLDALEKTVGTVLAWRVDDARNAGQSWDWIADALEVTRQSVWRKYRNKM